MRSECGVDPCRSVVAISSLAFAGPRLDSRYSSSGGIGMSAVFGLGVHGAAERSASECETPNVLVNRTVAVCWHLG